MNQIGSKKAPPPSTPAGKENVNPNTPPGWAITAKDYLLGTELGGEWRVCVHGWIEVENMLGYGGVAGAKVCIFFIYWDSD
jgi:hypothetical protein